MQASRYDETNIENVLRFSFLTYLLLHNGAGFSFISTNLNLSGDHSAEIVSNGVAEPDMLVSSIQNVSHAALTKKCDVASYEALCVEFIFDFPCLDFL